MLAKSSRSRLRSCLRSAAAGLALFSLLTLLRASVLISDVAASVFSSLPEVTEEAGGERVERAVEETVSLFISVKTTAKYHRTRLAVILSTWFNLAPKKIWFFTDKDDPEMRQVAGGHLVATGCPEGHKRQALCCKMGKEFDYFLKSGKSWMCHFDDDNYVNVRRLEELLSTLDPSRDHYLGRPSTRDRIQILDRQDPPRTAQFWFATGGAGFCLSRALGQRMAPLAADGGFVRLGERIRLPDDVTMGYLIHHLLGKELTVVDKFHSHLESMASIPPGRLRDQVSLSWGSYSSAPNVVSVANVFPDSDPSRFRSLHCLLFPNSDCPSS